MCNIAGYVGTRRAAPILLDMIKREEGLDGGFYTGIATIHEGKIFYTKLTGDTQKLIEDTQAASLPGNIGIIHSRTPSGGGDEWAQPFVSLKAGEVVSAYVANGGMGYFAGLKKERNDITQEIYEDGYELLSKVVMDSQKYPSLPDGTHVHSSDVVCQLIQRRIDRGQCVEDAMSDVNMDMPCEHVGVMLSLENTKGIYWSRFNMPMMLSFSDHGAYIASTAIAFPDDGRETMILPACTSGCVYQDKVEMRPFKKLPATVAPINARVRAEAYFKIIEELKGGNKIFPEIEESILPLFDEANCAQAAALAYDILYDVKKQGRLEIMTGYVPGVFEGLKAPKFYLSYKVE